MELISVQTCDESWIVYFNLYFQKEKTQFCPNVSYDLVAFTWRHVLPKGWSIGSLKKKIENKKSINRIEFLYNKPFGTIYLGLLYSSSSHSPPPYVILATHNALIYKLQPWWCAYPPPDYAPTCHMQVSIQH